ncbi:116aa long hypothetical protein [Pyrococcus horikoshii OT3]|uniref:Uncharacterized protein n=1 Tax=Pyrococcus horikoshii (strain ATCC 700860 / DSM 12428 / JCM 9974 / NBRC 100139 / OT-3) TaxID=70601 RepID=O58811_PYRHO|nr:116aa long hypothetical protein [Pyrococcus horikoshii OT3]
MFGCGISFPTLTSTLTRSPSLSYSITGTCFSPFQSPLLMVSFNIPITFALWCTRDLAHHFAANFTIIMLVSRPYKVCYSNQKCFRIKSNILSPSFSTKVAIELAFSQLPSIFLHLH